MNLKKWISAGALLAVSLAPLPGFAEEPVTPTPVVVAPASPAPVSLEQRIADLEAAHNNGALSPVAKADEGKTRPLTATTAPGHNGFMMICAALVLFMTLPGLFLFYGGLVRAKNVLSVAGQCLGMAGMVTLMWWAFGYSLVFGSSFTDSCPAIAPFLGGTEFLFFKGVTSAPGGASPWIGQNIFAMFQLMFAIITPALIVGAIAERMKFSAVMLFSFLWMIVVYFPMAHMIWGGNGFMNGLGNNGAPIPAIDFAGGTVVHMTSGWSALLLCLIIGKRTGFGKQKMMPHSMVLCAVGTGMLWVGWYGFNAGSALAADGIATNAFTTTTLAAATAAFVWGGLEWIIRKHASILGMCSGVVAGLVVITPAAGFCTTTGAVIIGVLAGVVPFVFVTYIKAKFNLDDSLDTFGVHGIGGTLGAIVTGVLASSEANANLLGDPAKKNGLANLVTDGGLWLVQLKAVAITVVIALVATAAIAYLVKALVGLRPTEEQESQGLDITDHGEDGYAI